MSFMMKKIAIIFLLVAGCINSNTFAQNNIKMSLYSNLEEIKIDASYIRYIFRGRQTFDIKNNTSDSLVFTFRNSPYPFPAKEVVKQLGIQELYPGFKTTLTDSRGQTAEGAVVEFDGEEIFVKNAPKECNLEVEYPYSNTFFLRSDSLQMLTFISPYISYLNSWYFIPKSNVNDTAIFENFTINLNKDGVYFFATCPYEKRGTEYILDTKKTQDIDISFFVLEKDFYERYLITPNMSVYFSRGTVIDTIAETATPRDSLEKSLVKERLTFIKNNVDRIENLLGAPYSKIDIADMYWGRGKMREGHNFETSDKTYFILVDKAFWNLASLTHEILHCYTDYDYDSDHSTNSAKYLFSESMIEYLGYYITYSNPTERDSMFNKKNRLYTERYPHNTTSVFEITENSMSGNEGSMPVIYLKAPFEIHSFAKRIGEEKFIKILMKLYKYVRKNNNIVRFSDFERIVLKNGVKKQDWLRFKNSI